MERKKKRKPCESDSSDEQLHMQRKKRRSLSSSDSDHQYHRQTTKKKKKTRRDSSSSQSDPSEGERKKSKERRKEKERSKNRKEEAHKKEKRKRKRKHHRSDDSSCSSDDQEERLKKKRLLKEAKRILKSHKKQRSVGSEDAANDKSATSHKVISEEDYYAKNKEFSQWLKEERGIYFSSLSADDARRCFGDFADVWNAGKLPHKLYQGVNSAARTDHKWQFKGDRESSIDREEELEFMKKLEKSQRKKFRKEHNEVMDELLPKATGRERLLEKKAVRREEARLLDDSPELLREQDVMGGGDDFKQRLERDRARRDKKAMERREDMKKKQLAMEQKESAAMDQFKAIVNERGGKISIPKRVE